MPLHCPGRTDVADASAAEAGTATDGAGAEFPGTDGHLAAAALPGRRAWPSWLRLAWPLRRCGLPAHSIYRMCLGSAPSTNKSCTPPVSVPTTISCAPTIGDLLRILEVHGFQKIDLRAIKEAAHSLAEETGTWGRTWDGTVPDDFEPLAGVGRSYEGRLYSAGICTYRALAESTPEQLAAICPAEVGRAPDYMAWIEQARAMMAECACPQHLAGVPGVGEVYRAAPARCRHRYLLATRHDR